MSERRRNAIITGSGSGLGRALAVRLAKDGWNLALADINAAGNQETLTLVEKAGGTGRLEALDVTKRDEWFALRERLRAEWERLDLVVNNAGVFAGGEIACANLDDWEWMLGVNLQGVYLGCHTFIDWLKQNPDGGHLVNTASMAGIAHAPAIGGYNATKAGVVALSETLYAELKRDRVGVTVICPLFFQTNLVKSGKCEAKLRELGENSMRKAHFDADHVADRAVRAMYRKRFYVIVPLRGKIYWWIKRISPRFLLRALAFRYRNGLPDSI